MNQLLTSLSSITSMMGVTLAMLVALITALRWLFSRPSDKIMYKLHSENLAHLDIISKQLGEISPVLARMEERMDRAEKDINDLRRWKHERAEPYLGAVDVLKARIDALVSIR